MTFLYKLTTVYIETNFKWKSVIQWVKGSACVCVCVVRTLNRCLLKWETARSFAAVCAQRNKTTFSEINLNTNSINRVLFRTERLPIFEGQQPIPDVRNLTAQQSSESFVFVHIIYSVGLLDKHYFSTTYLMPNQRVSNRNIRFYAYYEHKIRVDGRMVGDNKYNHAALDCGYSDIKVIVKHCVK